MRRPPPLTEALKYPVVSGTLVLAIGVTLASLGAKVDVSALYANVEIRRWELWRLITSTLPHVDFLHLIFNAYWTWVFGTLVEESFGHLKTLGIFILLAIAANGAEYAILSGGVGLSGVGYGLFGLLWVLSRQPGRFADAVDQNTIVLFVVWFFICIFLTLAGKPIGNIAHGVGALMGAMLGWIYAASPRKRLAGWAVAAVFMAAVLVGSTVARPWVNLGKDRGIEEAQVGYDALMADRNEEALRWYRDATRMQPGEATYWFNLGIAYDRLDRHADAILQYKKALALEPSNKEYRSAVEGGHTLEG